MKSKPSAEAIGRHLNVLRQKEAEDRAKAKAAALGLEYRDLHIQPINREALAFLDARRAQQGQAVVVRRLGKTVTLASVEPDKTQTKELVAALKQKGLTVDIVVISPGSLSRALKIYAELPQASVKKITGAITVDEERLRAFSTELTALADLSARLPVAIDQDTSAVLELLLAGALRLEASDLHIETGDKTSLLRLRIDGVLHPIASVDLQVSRPLVRRIKLLSDLKLNVTQKPQDGRFSLVWADTAIELRTSVIPGEYGEDVVLRILNPRTIRLTLEELGLREDLYERVTAVIRRPHGLIITTGPTGSGKTTALYAFLRKLASPELKIITIEDPIEYHLKDVAQTQVEPERGYTFASALRSVLRQDPDAILVGEIRDLETAETAIHAALTGHMVFTTLHTNDAAGTIPRLIDLGAKPNNIAPALSLSLAQRLVRKLCPRCRVPYQLTLDQRTRLEHEIAPMPAALVQPLLKNPLTVFTAKGCAECLDGYRGRIGVFEAFFMDEALERLVLESPTHRAVREAAIKGGMLPLRQDALLKILAGVTSFDEVERVVGSN